MLLSDVERKDFMSKHPKLIPIPLKYKYWCSPDGQIFNEDSGHLEKIFIKGMDLVAGKSEYCTNIEDELSKIGIDVGDDMNDMSFIFSRYS